MPISWGEVESWARLTGRAPTSWHARVLREIDGAYLDEARAWLSIRAPKHGDDEDGWG